MAIGLASAAKAGKETTAASDSSDSVTTAKTMTKVRNLFPCLLTAKKFIRLTLLHFYSTSNDSAAEMI